MSIQAIRDAFKAPDIRCVAARMRYTDDRKAQILEFDIVRGRDNLAKTIISDPIPHGQNLTAAAAKIAADAVDALK
jgi:hypothetical protein